VNKLKKRGKIRLNFARKNATFKKMNKPTLLACIASLLRVSKTPLMNLPSKIAAML